MRLFKRFWHGAESAHTGWWLLEIFGWGHYVTATAVTVLVTIGGYFERLAGTELLVLALVTFAIVLWIFEGCLRLGNRLPLGRRKPMGVGLICLGILAIVAGVAVLQTRQPEHEHLGAPATGPAVGASTVINENVTSYGQSGGITAHTVGSDAPRQ
jgi:uncharacterized membrane protein HdeD (DUF308 family)